MSEQPTGADVPQTTTATTPDRDAAYWQDEAKRAFKERDDAKKRARELEGRVLPDEQVTEYQTLKQQREKAEEERKRREGEFDTWRASIQKRHDEELQARDQKVQTATQRYHQKLTDWAFASASDWFGESGKSVLPPDVASSYFSKYIEVQEIDGDDVVVVKDAAGHVVLDPKTGKPATFSDAMSDLVASLPKSTQDRILRGSGKTGSGSSGGSTTKHEATDLSRLKSGDFSDPKVQQALKAQMAAAGGLQIGRAFDRLKK